MERRFTLDLYKEYDKVNFYTIHFDGESDTEFDKFLSTFSSSKHLPDLQKILAVLKNLSIHGVLERYFRRESKMNDGVGAIPIDTSELRLYCLRLCDSIIVLGSGGVKPRTQRTYNEDPLLNDCVKVLATLDSLIKMKITQGKISMNGKSITGDLKFYIKQND